MAIPYPGIRKNNYKEGANVEQRAGPVICVYILRGFLLMSPSAFVGKHRLL